MYAMGMEFTTLCCDQRAAGTLPHPQEVTNPWGFFTHRWVTLKDSWHVLTCSARGCGGHGAPVTLSADLLKHSLPTISFSCLLSYLCFLGTSRKALGWKSSPPCQLLGEPTQAWYEVESFPVVPVLVLPLPSTPLPIAIDKLHFPLLSQFKLCESLRKYRCYSFLFI